MRPAHARRVQTAPFSCLEQGERREDGPVPPNCVERKAFISSRFAKWPHALREQTNRARTGRRIPVSGSQTNGTGRAGDREKTHRMRLSYATSAWVPG